MNLLPYSPERDVYRLLGVPPTSDSETVLSACRRLARTFHPDRNVSPRATDEMQVVNAIRLLLTDPHQRAAYDHARRRWHEIQALRRAQPTPRAPAPLATRGRGARSGTAARYLRAARAGLLAALDALLPSRCDRCRGMVEPDDAYCPSCGARRRAAPAGGTLRRTAG